MAVFNGRNDLCCLFKLQGTYRKCCEPDNLSQARYDKGVDSFLQVLDAQRTWYSAKQQLITGQQALLASQINLYKAVGGGWEVTTPQNN